MKQELEIGGKTYILNANRKVATLLEKGVKVDKNGNTEVELPETKKVFYVLLSTDQPDVDELEAEKLLEQADTEYGVAQMTRAVNQMINSVFSQGSDTSQKDKKIIPWLKKDEEDLKENSNKE